MRGSPSNFWSSSTTLWQYSFVHLDNVTKVGCKTKKVTIISEIEPITHTRSALWMTTISARPSALKGSLIGPRGMKWVFPHGANPLTITISTSLSKLQCCLKGRDVSKERVSKLPWRCLHIHIMLSNRCIWKQKTNCITCIPSSNMATPIIPDSSLLVDEGFFSAQKVLEWWM
jgi:hypothetical protein